MDLPLLKCYLKHTETDTQTDINHQHLKYAEDDYKSFCISQKLVLLVIHYFIVCNPQRSLETEFQLVGQCSNRSKMQQSKMIITQYALSV